MEGAVLYQPPPCTPPFPRLSSIISGTVRKRDPRPRGAQEVRFGGGHQGIEWSQSEKSGQQRFTATNGAGIPTPIGYGGEAREGVSTIMRDQAGRGWGVSALGKSGEEKVDVNGEQRGGASGRMGKINVETTTDLG